MRIGLIHTRRATRRKAKQMEPVCLNGSVHTARKQHQSVCPQIRVLAFSVDEPLSDT